MGPHRRSSVVYREETQSERAAPAAARGTSIRDAGGDQTTRGCVDGVCVVVIH